MSSSDVAVRVQNLGKAYTIQHNQTKATSLKEAVTRKLRDPFRRPDREQFWALKDVDFEIARGEVLGVIGRNGAGKSTLLKLLSRISYPTTGSIELYGRVGSLLEVGTGFHRELTGRENIYLNGSILGMSRAEITRQFDAIVDFAGTEKFLDTPVKRYSSGMYVRLAFAVAAHLQPEILIVDEVLAVGDLSFQRKCLGRMQEISEQGRTVLFVSHNMGVIENLCSRCLYLKDGQVRARGDTDQVVQEYTTDVEEATEANIADRTDRKGDGEVRIEAIRFLHGATLEPLHSVLSGQPVVAEVQYEGKPSLPNRLDQLNMGLAFHTLSGQFITVVNSHMAEGAFERVDRSGRVYCTMPRFPLMCGPFAVTATLKLGKVLKDQVENAARIDVEAGDYYGSGYPNAHDRQGVFIEQRWSTDVDTAADHLRDADAPHEREPEFAFSVAG